MGGHHTLHIIWIRGNVISEKVGQYERFIEGSGRYAQRNAKTPEKGPGIALGIPGVLHQDIQSPKPTLKGVVPHSRLMDTIYIYLGLEIAGQITTGGNMRCKNLGLGRLSRTIICDGSPAVGKVSIISDQNHKRKKTGKK